MSLCTPIELELTPTTQGPLYPPGEICDGEGNFVVVGRICAGQGVPDWGGAIVSPHTIPPAFGEAGRYDILRRFDPTALPADLEDEVLWTLPLPLPCNNYQMLFAPEQAPEAHRTKRISAPLHAAYVPDPFPDPARPGANRISNVILLYMSTRMSYGGAIGLHGLGADIHAQLKLTEPAFSDLVTVA